MKKLRILDFRFWIFLAILLTPYPSRLTPPAQAATGCAYPTTLDTFTDVTAGASLTATLFNKVQCAIEKAEAELGTLPKGTYVTVKARLDDAAYLVGNQTLAGIKTFSDVLTSALGTITADKQNLSATATWNAAGVTFTALKFNVTNTASAAASLLIDLQVDSVSKFKADKSGVVTATTFSGNATTATALAANPADCAANTFAQSSAASGDLTCSAVSLATADTTGTLTIAKGGTGQTTATAAFNALSPVTTLGDLIYRDASNNVRLAGNTTTTKKFLRETGDGVNAAAPAWDTLVSGDLPSHNHAAGDVNSGLLAFARGGLNTDISTSALLGDLLYGSSATAFARLAGNTTTTKKILMQTGTGAVSAAPAWSTIDTAALLDTGLCTDTQILKKVSGAWACATDATAGAPTWDSIANPATNQALSMGTATTTWTWSAATGAGVNMLTLKDTDNNTGTGYVASINTQAGSAAKPLRVTAVGTANGIEMTTAGGLAVIGSGTITANRTVCTGSDYLKFDGSCGAISGLLWSGIGNPTGNLALTMGAFTTTLTYNDATSTVDLFKLTDTASNTGTGSLLNIASAASSAIKPVKFTARGTANGIQMDTAGLLKAIGTGGIEATGASALITSTATGFAFANANVDSQIALGTTTDDGWTVPAFILRSGTFGGATLFSTDTATAIWGINIYSDGAQKYRTTNVATRLLLDNTSLTFSTFASGTAGAALASQIDQLVVGSSGVLVGNNPTGGGQGTGTINVDVNIFKDGSAYTNPDYVLEKFFSGEIVEFADREGANKYTGLRSLEEVERLSRQYNALPLIYEARQRNKNRLGLFDGGDAVLASLEEAYLYIFQLNKRVKGLEAKYEEVTINNAPNRVPIRSVEPGPGR